MPSRLGSMLNAARPITTVYAVAALTSTGTTLLVVAIFFYTRYTFHWTLLQNFLLATAQGTVYVIGSMFAGAAARKLDRCRALALVYAAMCLLSLLAFMVSGSAGAVIPVILLYTGVSSVGWPMLESLATSNCDAHLMSRRIGAYNLVWATTSMTALALDGTINTHWPGGIFIIPALVHGASCLIVLSMHRASADAQTDAHDAHPEPEPELLRMRKLALWLSRLALPSTYVAIYSLMALMPSLPVMKDLSAPARTAVSSVWMGTRLLAFVVMGASTWWHARPRLLLGAAVAVLITFFATTIRPSDVLAGSTQAIDLNVMIFAQIIMGVALGIIYSGSLYFGMVLSDGSTDHGGYHEALIGLGQLAGPGAGAIAQWLYPGNLYAGVASAGSIVFLSVVGVGIAAYLGRSRSRD